MATYFQLLDEHLPDKFTNVVCESCNDDKFYVIRSDVKNQQEIKEWMHLFEINSKTQWVYGRSINEGQKCVCMKKFLCHHSKRKKVPPHLNKHNVSKNAGCEAYIHIKVKLITRNTIHKDPYLKDNLCAVIKISKMHSHSLYSAQTLRFLRCDKQDVFEEYFNDGMTASEAKIYHESILSQKAGVDEIDLANARENPTRRTITHWYNEWRKKHLGPRSETEVIEKLKEKQVIYNVDNISIVFEEQPFSVVILTPIMKRAHHLPMASQVVFCDSTTFSDAENHSVTFFFTPCAAGVAPLGVLITKGGDVESYANAFNLLKMNCDNAFGNAGHPKMFITSNSVNQIDALLSIWPESNSSICTFHILQETQRWIWDKQHKIKKQHRIELLNTFKKLVWADNMSSFEDVQNKCVEFGEQFQYSQLRNYLNSDIWPLKEKWSFVHYDKITRTDQKNIFTAYSIRTFKDIVLSRVKAYNVISLVDYCCTVLEKLYAIKFCDYADTFEEDSYEFFRNRLKKTEYLKKENITELSPSLIYLVPSEKYSNTLYTVDISIGFCSCVGSRLGKICKHQCAVFHYFSVSSEYFPEITEESRQHMAYLALGLEDNEINNPCSERSSEENIEVIETKILLSDDIAVRNEAILSTDECIMSTDECIITDDFCQSDEDIDEVLVSVGDALKEKV